MSRIKGEIVMVDLKNIRKIHCIGIGGIGLSAIADILISQGFEVSGSDIKSSETTERLEEDGAVIFLSHEASNVENVDLIVYSAAVGDDNPEVVRAKELGIPMVTRADMLGTLMAQHQNSIAIAGTHGKTTTTSMISLILDDAGVDPTLLVGGNLEQLHGNVKVGHSDYFVTEACEYMDSFLSLCPKMEVILNIDSDHLDYFRDIDHIVDSFKKFVSLVPEDGKIFAYSANPFVQTTIKDFDNVITFGLDKACDYAAIDIKFNQDGMPTYDFYKMGTKITTVSLNLPGEHNILNSLAALACANELGIDIAQAVKTLEKFKGTQRRFDITGTTKDKVKIVDDYAHHPTEIKATLSAVKNIPHEDLWCIFQPHTYTRTIALFDDFVDAFVDADKIIMAEIYAAREKNIHKISSKQLAEAIMEKYPQKEVFFFDTFEMIADYVYKNAKAKDVVLTMGAGDVYQIGTMILDKDGK